MAFEFFVNINGPIQESYDADDFRRMAKFRAMTEMVLQHREGIEESGRRKIRTIPALPS